MADSTTEVVSRPNWIAGVLAAVVAGLIGAILYALPIGTTDDGLEIGYTALAIGFGVGWALSRYGKVSGLAAGIVGAIIAFLSWAFAVELGTSWFISSMGYGSIMENLGDVIPKSSDFFQIYFEESPKGYLFAAFAVVTAFIVASKLVKRSN